MSETDTLVRKDSVFKAVDILSIFRITTIVGGIYVFSCVPSTLPIFTSSKIAKDLPGADDKRVSQCFALFYVGWALSSAIIMPLSDRFGRRLPTFACLALGTLTFGLVSLSTTVMLFGILVFATGMTLPAAVQTGYLLICESVPAEWCSNLTVGMNVVYSIVVVIMAIVAKAAQQMNWRIETLCWICPYAMISLMGPCLISESPKFTKEVEASAARGGITQSALEAASGTNDAEENGSSFQMLSQPPYVRRVFDTTICWIASSMTYYGISWIAGNLSDDLYTNMMLFGCVDIIGYFIPAPIIAYSGLMRTQIASFAVAALVLMIGALLQPGTTLVILAMLGRLAIDVAFTTIYILLFDTFPDECRSTAMGAASLFARTASLVTPLLSNVPNSSSCLILGTVSLFAALATWDLQATKQETP